jgi:CMP-2-keto-3-deoxyoctulosonic acid synthetase
MYNTYKNEVLNRTGKKKPENILVNIQEDPQLSENEVIAKVERALREKKLRLNKTKNLLSNNSFLKDDENNSFNQELQMLTIGKTSDPYKKFK